MIYKSLQTEYVRRMYYSFFLNILKFELRNYIATFDYFKANLFGSCGGIQIGKKSFTKVMFFFVPLTQNQNKQYAVDFYFY